MPIDGLGTASTGAGPSAEQPAVPGSSGPGHTRENPEPYRFELAEAEMARINALDRGEKRDWY